MSQLDPEQFLSILSVNNWSRRETARYLGVTQDWVSRYATELRKGGHEVDDDPAYCVASYEPSPEEIAVACARFRRARPRQPEGYPEQPYQVPHAHAVCLRGRERVYEVE